MHDVGIDHSEFPIVVNSIQLLSPGGEILKDQSSSSVTKTIVLLELIGISLVKDLGMQFLTLEQMVLFRLPAPHFIANGWLLNEMPHSLVNVRIMRKACRGRGQAL